MATNRTSSGFQVEIRHGDQVAVITEVGATLRDYSRAGRRLIEGFGADEICSGGRGQVLVPWPNRIRDGVFRHQGEDHQLPLTDVEHRAAIHGLARWQPWRLAAQTPSAVRLELQLYPQPGYPWRLELEVGYALDGDGLRVETVARNPGPDAVPFGAGHHPYLHPGADRIDSGELAIPARSYLEVDAGLIPTGRRLAVAGTPFDFRQPRRLGTTALDLCFADLEEPRLRFAGLELWWDAAYSFLQLFTGDSLAPGRRRRGLAVEPMSCAPDAFNSGAGLVVLGPGASWSGTWGIR